MNSKKIKKSKARQQILRFMLSHGATSKVEIAQQLGISMPTVLSNIADLTDEGIVMDIGELESTGGRKARLLSLSCDRYFSVGVSVTANHLIMVFMNLAGQILDERRQRLEFTPDLAWCESSSEEILRFIHDQEAKTGSLHTIEQDPGDGKENRKGSILGIGIAFPGIVNTEASILVKSHSLNLENYSLRMIESMLPYPVYFENDANAALMAEDPSQLCNAIYLSLNQTVGGSICMNHELFRGQVNKAGEFGHIILVPHGRQCYCGKKGCADAYLSAAVLTDNGDISPERFIEMTKTSIEAAKKWDEYLSYLAILVSNLRMAFDTDIILGGDIGGILDPYRTQLGHKIMEVNLFDRDLSYLKTCTCRRYASAVGAGKHFFYTLPETL